MADADRLVAALRYQQELDAAQRPAMINPNLEAQGLKSRNRLASALSSQSPDWSGEALPMEGRATFLPFQDTAGKRSLALPGIVAGVVNAFTAPGRAFSGSDPTFNPEEEAANFASNVMGGGIGASRAVPAPAGSLGMFIGKTAKTWNAEAEAKALQMEKRGETPQAIWRDTGNWKAPDGAWRQEIPDNTATAKSLGWGSTADLNKGNSTVESLQNALQHSRLGRAYPGTTRGSDEFGKNIAVKIRSGGGERASYNDGVISVGDVTGFDGSKRIQKSPALHEVQHYIQEKEGWAKGGNPENAPIAFMDEISAIRTAKNQLNIDPYAIQNKKAAGYPLQKYEVERYKQWANLTAMEDDLLVKSRAVSPYEQYLRLAGEAEARATQTRIPLDATQRRALFPANSYDVPLDQLIIRR